MPYNCVIKLLFIVLDIINLLMC